MELKIGKKRRKSRGQGGEGGEGVTTKKKKPHLFQDRREQRGGEEDQSGDRPVEKKGERCWDSGGLPKAKSAVK